MDVMGEVEVTQRHREHWSEEKDGQQYHSALLERMETGGRWET